MSERFLYEDGVELSLSSAYRFVQDIANNRVRSFTKIATYTPGFLGDSFEPITLEKDPTSASVYYIKLKAGKVIFPNGEMYRGNDFTCRVSINRHASTQYLKIKHNSLYRTEQTQAFGENGHAEVIDGAQLEVTSNPDLLTEGTDLLIARIDYFPDMTIPDVTDVRDAWVFFWSPATIVDPNSEAGTYDRFYYSSKSGGDPSAINILDSYDINSETSTIIWFAQDADENIHNWETFFVPSSEDYALFSERFHHPIESYGGEEYISVRLPNGLSGSMCIRKADAYRDDLVTDWSTSDPMIVSYDWDTTNVSLNILRHNSLPFVAMRFHTDDDISTTGYFVKIWLSMYDNNDTRYAPNYILPLKVTNEPAEVPYVVIPYDEAAEMIYYTQQVFTPGHQRASATAEGMFPVSAPSGYGSEDVIQIDLGGDRFVSETITPLFVPGSPPDGEDVRGQRIIYGDLGFAHFYLPWSERVGENLSMTNRYLSKIEFINYADAGNSKAVVSFDTINAQTTIDFGEEPSAVAGDTVTISNSSDILLLPDGNYTVITVIGSEISFTSGGANGNGTCDIEWDTNITASIKIVRDPGGRPGTTTEEWEFSTFLIGQDNGASFPHTYYSDSETLNHEDYEFPESAWYKICAYDATGESRSYMEAMGHLKLYFKKAAYE